MFWTVLAGVMAVRFISWAIYKSKWRELWWRTWEPCPDFLKDAVECITKQPHNKGKLETLFA